MSEQHLRVLTHYCTRESVSLIWTEVVPAVPSSTNQLFEVLASIDALIVGCEVVQDLGRSVDAFRSHAGDGGRPAPHYCAVLVRSGKVGSKHLRWNMK